MIEDARGRIDYDEYGSGPAIVLVPGSCSTGAAWRGVIAALGERFRCVTTSVLGYGGTAERRTRDDCAMSHETDIVELVIRNAGGRVHLVGHSFGAMVALTAALRRQTQLASLTILEAPAANVLRDTEPAHHRAFHDMTDRYFAAFEAGDSEAIAHMIDFYGGPGTFASWSPRVRAYAMETTPVNILDWATAYAFPLPQSLLATVDVPSLVLWGEASHPAAQRANALLGEYIGASTATIAGAAHFMIATHAEQVATAIAAHVDRAEDKLAH